MKKTKIKLSDKIMVLCCAITLLTGIFLSASAYRIASKSLISHAEDHLETEARLLAKHLSVGFENMAHDVMVLLNLPPIQGIIRAEQSGHNIDPMDSSSLETWLDRQSIIFQSFLHMRPNYTQIRIIKRNGMELVRVNRHAYGVEQVHLKDLQNKSAEPYVVRGITLKQGEVYYAPITYNREFERVDPKFIRTLRVMTPIYSKQGVIFGLLVINVNYQHFISERLKASKVKTRTKITSVDGDVITYIPEASGRALITQVFNKNKTPKSFRASLGLQESEDDVSYSMLLSQKNNLPLVKLEVTAPKAVLYQRTDRIFWILMLQSLGILLFSAIAIYALAKRMLLPLNQVTQIVQSSEKRMEKCLKPYAKRDDEIGMLATAFIHKLKALEALSCKDALTNLANRKYFLSMIEQVLQQAHKEKKTFGVLFMDLDNFKSINDTLGHVFGDLLLYEASKRIKNVLSQEDFVCRIGGDEFAVISLTKNKTHTLVSTAGRILEAFHQPFHISAREINISISIGIAAYPAGGESVDALLKNSDMAMYQAKKKGGDSFSIFTDSLKAQAIRRYEIETALQKAITNQEFSLVYQPIIHIKTNTVTEIEALVRWHNDRLKSPKPDEFIPIAEATRHIIPIGEWVLSEALDTLTSLQEKSHINKLRMAINISAYQLLSERFISFCKALFGTYPALKEHLIFEITETALLQELHLATQVLETLKHLGITFAIDDFGTGYSSMKYLRHLPLSILKIDKSFIDGIGKNIQDESIIDAILSLAKSFHLQTIAEGIETERQMDFLRQRGCDSVQGYFIAKPMSQDELMEFLARYK